MTYLYQGKKNYTIPLHNLVIGAPLLGKEIDHIDRTPLNNLPENLRFATNKEQSINRPYWIDHNKPSWGATFNKKRNGWLSYIHFDGRRMNGRWFKTMKEAHGESLRKLENMQQIQIDRSKTIRGEN